MTEHRQKLVQRLRGEFELGTLGYAAADEIEGLEGVLGAVEWFLENEGYNDHPLTLGIRDILYRGKNFGFNFPAAGPGKLARYLRGIIARGRRYHRAPGKGA